MKYGLIYCKNGRNIGDDILSYASEQFLPRIDYFIDRERLGEFIAEDREMVKAVANCWFIHDPLAFLPSPSIVPLYIGAHFHKDVLSVMDQRLEFAYLENSRDFLSTVGPIGCRDRYSFEVLHKLGIPCYISYCLTLLIKKFEDVHKDKFIVLSDCSEELISFLKNKYPQESFVQVTHLTPLEEVGAEWNVKRERVEQVLKTYQAAKLVITTRLHAALPSVAFGTPVIMIKRDNDDYKERISFYEDMFLAYTEKELMSEEINLNDLDYEKRYKANQRRIQMIRKEVEERCKEFLQDKNNLEELSPGYREAYFESTSRIYRSCMKSISLGSEGIFKQIQEAGQFDFYFIYGIGNEGKRIKSELEIRGYDNFSYVVTDNMHKTKERASGIPIYVLNDIDQLFDGKNICILIPDNRYCEELKTNCVNYGFPYKVISLRGDQTETEDV